MADNLFFIASKLVWGLLSPTNLTICFVVIATACLLLRRIRWALLLLVLVSVLDTALMLYPIGDWLIYPLEQRFMLPTALPEHVDGIIVLGGGEKMKMSIARRQAQVGEGAERYLTAGVLARKYPLAPVIFSGGSGALQFQASAPVQAQVASQLLTDVGIKNARLIIESQSRNTYENFINIKPLLPDSNGTYLLITSAFHMPRAVGIARQQHINVIPYPVDYRSNPPQYRQWDMDFSDHSYVLDTAWHEWLGLTVYFLNGKTADWFPAPITSVLDATTNKDESHNIR